MSHLSQGIFPGFRRFAVPRVKNPCISGFNSTQFIHNEFFTHFYLDVKMRISIHPKVFAGFGTQPFPTITLTMGCISLVFYLFARLPSAFFSPSPGQSYRCT